MSQTDNLYSEISKTKAQWQTLIAGYFKSGLRPVIVNLGSFSDGTRYAVTDQYRDVKFYLVSDLTAPTKVSQLLAGTGITVSPAGGTGAVTVNSAHPLLSPTHTATVAQPA